eukprot:TRINITY_DN18403_c0_g1_i1.p1 TRINITY_DN18403_c0_g1~~TRINITY_DN18403_c0_g1_i1.p1  ORF type:complete len:311 (-),score=78.90 TRINITY_DN18403_c0_g1_i1:229-1161(-)
MGTCISSSKKTSIEKYGETVEADGGPGGAGGSSLKESESDARLYLSRFGYGLAGIEPQLDLGVEGCREKEGRTKYEVRCALRLPEEQTAKEPVRKTQEPLQVDALFDVLPLCWTCWRRLGELREQLYDPVKDSLGSAYDTHFANSPFAMRIALTGNTERLHAWMDTLAECANKKLLPVQLLAMILRCLEAPAPEEGEDGVLLQQGNIRKERRLQGGSLEFTIAEWRSNWQVELKERLLKLGTTVAEWEIHVSLRDASDTKLLVKCREDGYPYVTPVDSALKGQPIHFPVVVTVQSVVIRDQWATKSQKPV